MTQEFSTEAFKQAFVSENVTPNKLKNKDSEPYIGEIVRIYSEEHDGAGEVVFLPAEIKPLSSKTIPDYDKAIEIIESLTRMDQQIFELNARDAKFPKKDNFIKAIKDVQFELTFNDEEKLLKIETIMKSIFEAYGVGNLVTLELGMYAKSADVKYSIEKVIGLIPDSDTSDSEETVQEEDEFGTDGRKIDNANKIRQRVFSFDSKLEHGDAKLEEGDYEVDMTLPLFNVNIGFSICDNDIIIGSKITRQSFAVALAVYASMRNGSIEPNKVREVAKNLGRYSYFTSLWQRDGTTNTSELKAKLNALKSLSIQLHKSKNGVLPVGPEDISQ